MSSSLKSQSAYPPPPLDAFHRESGVLSPGAELVFLCGP